MTDAASVGLRSPREPSSHQERRLVSHHHIGGTAENPSTELLSFYNNPSKLLPSSGNGKLPFGVGALQSQFGPNLHM